MLLLFSGIEIALKFSVDHNESQEVYLEPQLFKEQKNICLKKTFDSLSF